MLTELPKIAKITLFLSICIPSLHFRCGDIEKNPGPKYFSLTFNLIRSVHPSDLKRGGIFIYYKEHIPVIKWDDICTLDNCVETEIWSQSEKCFLTCIYGSPSQNNEEFENFVPNFWFTSQQYKWRNSYLFNYHWRF